MVHVPAVAAEDKRPLHRDLETLQQKRATATTRITGWLSSPGIRRHSLPKLPEQLEALRLWDGAPMPPGLRRRVLRVSAHDTCLRAQIAAWDAARRALLQSATDASLDTVHQLLHRRGLGINGSWWLGMEFFAWRARKTRREVGGLAG